MGHVTIWIGPKGEMRRFDMSVREFHELLEADQLATPAEIEAGLAEIR